MKEIEAKLKKAGAERWAWIRQEDSKKGIEPHIHLVIKFKNPRSISQIAKLLEDNPERFQAWTGFTNAISYLPHLTKGARLKTKYNPDQIHANFDVKKFLETVEKHIKKSTIRDALIAFGDGEISEDELLRKIGITAYEQHGYEIRRRRRLLAQRENYNFRKMMRETGRKVKAVAVIARESQYQEVTDMETELLKQQCKSVARLTEHEGFFSDYEGEHGIIFQLPSYKYYETHNRVKSYILDILDGDWEKAKQAGRRHEFINCEYMIINVFVDEDYTSPVYGPKKIYTDVDGLHFKRPVLYSELDWAATPGGVEEVYYEPYMSLDELKKSVKKILTD